MSSINNTMMPPSAAVKGGKQNKTNPANVNVKDEQKHAQGDTDEANVNTLKGWHGKLTFILLILSLPTH
jgi:hypothetical protein